MAHTIEVYTICAQCSGTGQQPTGAVGGGIGPTIPCTWPGCNATGKYVIGYVDIDDIMDKLADIVEKVDEVKVVVDSL